MKKAFISICIAAFSLMSMFCICGYAQVSGSLVIDGTATAIPPINLFITDTAVDSTSYNAEILSHSYLYPTTLVSTATLGAGKDSKASIEVTVYNNSSEAYEFNTVKYSSSDYSNENITFTAINNTTGKQLWHGDRVEPGSYLTFTVEFSYIDGYAPSTVEQIDSLLNFEFLPISELPDVYIHSVEVIEGGATYTQDSIGAHILYGSIIPDELTVYKITMNNRSEHDYGYSATVVDTTKLDNNKISYSLYVDEGYSTKLQRRELLPAAANGTHGSITFYLMATDDDATTYWNPLDACFDIRFETPIDSIDPPSSDAGGGQIAVENALDKFKIILNNDIELSALENLLDNVASAGYARNDSYVAYVPGAPANDRNASLELFDGKLEISIDGEKQNVYFLIKREDVTGDGKDDYTVYMTTNALESESTVSGQEGWFFNKYYTVFKPSYATIYAAVFTVNDSDEWIQLGDMFKGQAPICDYDGGMENYRPSGATSNTKVPTGSGSFHTDTWVTTEEYYSVASGSTLSAVISKDANDLTMLSDVIALATSITENPGYRIDYSADKRTALDTALTNGKSAYRICTDSNNTNDYTQAEIVTFTNEIIKAINALYDES